jgi:hypothetical protein
MLHMLGKPRSIWLAVSILAYLITVQNTASQVPHRFPLESMRGGIPEKGRLQDVGDNAVISQILAAGKSSIPVLISQLTESARTKEPIEPFWSYTASGDIAFMFLTDLFTDKDLRSSTMPEAPNWEKIMAGCNENAEACWRKYVQRRGIRSVQHSWRTAWENNQDRIVWDNDSRCFRLRM